MRISSDKEMTEALAGVSFLIGDEETVAGMPRLASLKPFADEMHDMLNDVSRLLLADREAKAYPDVVTFAFWIRKSSTAKLRERSHREDGTVRLGRGVVFHIAPSNVPVNYAYSLAAGLLTGNANIVRVPSKDFPQMGIINRAIEGALEKHEDMRPYICLIRYGRERKINDALSALADVRVIWGGDVTIAELRKSPLKPRAGEITFADRFSLAVIDSGSYLALDERRKDRTTEDFYNDTYLTDQNACTSPRMVVWMGDSGRIREAKEEFWGRLHRLVKERYTFQPIMGVNKLTSGCLAAVAYGEDSCRCADRDRDRVSRTEAESDGTALNVRIEPHTDNFLVRVRIPKIMDGLMNLKDNSGYFFEYDCEDILELRNLCNDTRCQTIAYIGEKDMLMPLLRAGVKGIDRIVPVGHTMDFDLIWDGYDLVERMTRITKVL